MIWEIAHKEVEPRSIRLYYDVPRNERDDVQYPHLYCPIEIPVLLRATAESRQLLLKYYKQMWKTSHVYINLSIDTLHFRCKEDFHGCWNAINEGYAYSNSELSVIKAVHRELKHLRFDYKRRDFKHFLGSLPYLKGLKSVSLSRKILKGEKAMFPSGWSDKVIEEFLRRKWEEAWTKKRGRQAPRLVLYEEDMKVGRG